MSARSPRARWLWRGVAVLAALPVVLALGVALLLGTGWGRARVLAELLARVNQSIPGQLEVGALERLGPSGLVLADVRLRDPASTPVLALARVSVELAPLELLHGRIVLPRVALAGGNVDLRQLDVPGRGLLGAVSDPDAPPSPPDPSPPPYVRVDHVELSALSVRAPELPPPWQDLRVARIDATARFELDGDPEFILSSLSCELLRGEHRLARLVQLTAHLARPGQASELALQLELGAVRVNASAGGVLPSAAEFASAPLEAELHLGGVTAPSLAELLDDPALAAAFEGPIVLDAGVSGHLERLALHTALGTAAGSIELNGSLRERRFVALEVTAADLALSRLRPELPAAPLSLSLESSADLADPARIPVTLRAGQGRLGRFELPALDAGGVWTGQSLDELSIEIEQAQSRVVVRGGIDRAGAFDLRVGVDVTAAELRALAAAAGVATPPRAALGADLHVVRSAAGALSLRGDVQATGVRLPDVALDSGRVELALDGTPPELEGRADVRVTGLSLGSLRIPRATLALDAGHRQYRLRASAAINGSSATVDLHARREPEHWALSGNASGRWNELPVALRIGPTAVSPDGWITTRGVNVDAGGQVLRVTGSYGRPAAELRVTASALDVNALAKLAGLGAEWRGRAGVELGLRGSAELPVLDATLDVRELSRRGAAPISAQLVARLDASDGRASLDATLVDPVRPGWLDATVALAAEFPAGRGWQRRLGDAHPRATIELRRLDLEALEPWIGRPVPVSAVLDLSASLEGSLRQPVLHATARAALAEAFGLPALQIEQALDYQAGALAATLVVDDAGGRWLSLDTELTLAPADMKDLRALPARARTLGDTSRWSVRVDAARRRLGDLYAALPPALAGLEVDGHVQVGHEPGAEPTGQASWHVREAAARGSSAGCSQDGVELALDAELARKRLSASLNARHRGTELMTATATADVALAAALRGGPASLGELSGELTARGLELEKVPYLCQRVRGRIDARAQLVDPLGATPSLLAEVKATDLSLGAEPSLDVELQARADHQSAEATVGIAGPRGRSTLSAALPISWSSGRFALAADAPLQAHVELVALPIAPLLDPAGAVSYATGWLSGEVAVGGTLAAPEPSGTLELRDAELTATALAQPLHGVHGRVAFDGQAITIEQLEARDRDGKIDLSGRVARRGADALDVTLAVNAEQFPLRQRGQVVATTSGRATIHAAVEPQRTNVTVKLVDVDTWLEKVQPRTGIDLDAHPDFVIAGAAAEAADDGGGSGPAAGSPELPRESIVRLDASDHFWIKRDDFAIQLSAQLDAQISGDQVKVTGPVDIRRGYLDLLGRVFDVARGSGLEFIGGSTPDPVVNVSAVYDHKSSGKRIKVVISGRGSKPVLTFFIDDGEVSAGEALELLVGRRGSGGEDSAKQEATSFVSALTAGLLATSARRELGAAAPIIMIEPGDQTGDGRIRAGFELDSLVPPVLRQLITGVYVEGIVAREGSDQSRGRESSTQAGVLLELYFPYQLFSTGQWGPGTTWSIDWGWQL